MKTKISSILDTKTTNVSDVEYLLEEINDILYEAADVCINKKWAGSKKKRKQRTNKWYDANLPILRHELMKLGKQVAKDFKNQYLRHKFFAMKKRFKKLASRKKTEYKQTILEELESLEKNNPKGYWALFDKSKTGETGSNNMDPITEDEWVRHYSKLLGPKEIDKRRENIITSKLEPLKADPYFSELDYAIKFDEISQAIKSIKMNKAVGIDCSSGEMIRCSADVMLGVYQKLFNSILNVSHYPRVWKRGIIVNLYKSGQRVDTDNYRGLTINSCLSKLFNTIINNRIFKYLLENNEISQSQIGFKKKARTSDHVFVMNVLLQKYTARKKKLYMCFVDFKKAYDSVWREALFVKVMEMGIQGKIFRLIECMYKDIYSCVKISDVLSDDIKCERGVRQGDVLSPNLFNIFVNDLPQWLGVTEYTPVLGNDYVNCLMYADDLAILSLSVDDLQAQLNKLFEYCQIWGLEVNTAKTKVMVLSKSGFKKPTNELKLGNQVLQWTSAYKYLGLELHNNGNYVKTAENLCSRGWKAIFKINSSLRNISVKTSTRLHLFDTLVKPIICYGSEVWGSMVNGQSAKVDVDKFWNKAEKIPCEKLHKKFLKICLGVHSKASNAAGRGRWAAFP